MKKLIEQRDPWLKRLKKKEHKESNKYKYERKTIFNAINSLEVYQALYCPSCIGIDKCHVDMNCQYCTISGVIDSLKKAYNSKLKLEN